VCDALPAVAVPHVCVCIGGVIESMNALRSIAFVIIIYNNNNNYSFALCTRFLFICISFTAITALGGIAAVGGHRFARSHGPQCMSDEQWRYIFPLSITQLRLYFLNSQLCL